MNSAYPPSSPIAWRVSDLSGAMLGVVVAQLWAEARAEAAIVFGRTDVHVEALTPSQAPQDATNAPPLDQSGVADARRGSVALASGNGEVR